MIGFRCLVAVLVVGPGLCGCAGNLASEVSAEQYSAWQTAAESRCSRSRVDEGTMPPKPFSTDGCTLWPDSEWRDCCVSHDMTYWCGGSYTDRLNADKALQKCVAETGHPVMGFAMRVGTRIGGLSVLPTPWRWGYGWHWPKSGKRETAHATSSVDGEESSEVDRQ